MPDTRSHEYSNPADFMRTLLFSCTVLAFLAAPGVAAQDRTPEVASGVQAGGFYLSRGELQDLLARHEEVATAPGQATEVRENALASARRIRTRLREGDFKAGDRIVLEIRTSSGSIVLAQDTVAIRPGPAIALENMGSISLDGVLRSELEEHLGREVREYIRSPVVEVTSLVRISVQGQVGSPGFYSVPAYMALPDVLMVAGGPSSNADLEKIRLERVDEEIAEGEVVQQALADGLSLDRLNLEAGDQIVVPEESSSPWLRVGRFALIIGSTFLLGQRIFF